MVSLIHKSTFIGSFSYILVCTRTPSSPKGVSPRQQEEDAHMYVLVHCHMMYLVLTCVANIKHTLITLSISTYYNYGMSSKIIQYCTICLVWTVCKNGFLAMAPSCKLALVDAAARNPLDTFIRLCWLFKEPIFVVRSQLVPFKK